MVSQVQHPIAATNSNIPNLTSQSISQTIIKQPTQTVQSVHLPPVTCARVASPILNLHQKPIQTQSHGKSGQPISPVLNNVTGPPNPKQHLLQAAKQQQHQASAIVSLQPKLPTSVNVHPGHPPIIASPTQRIHIPTQTVTSHLLTAKAHLLQAVASTIVTGTVASPPAQARHIPSQAVVGNIPCSRNPITKSQVVNYQLVLFYLIKFTIK